MSEQDVNSADMNIGSDEPVGALGFTPEQDAAGDGTDGVSTPPDEPVAVTDFGTTVAEEREGESLEGRLSRELPDATLEVPYPTDEGVTGRLVDADQGALDDTEKDSIAYDVGADAGGVSAEEAAMHVIPE